jgi:hypothetical protein
MKTETMITRGMNKNKGINKAQGLLIGCWPLVDGWRLKAIRKKSTTNNIIAKHFIALTNREPKKQLEYLFDAKRTAGIKELNIISSTIKSIIKDDIK